MRRAVLLMAIGLLPVTAACLSQSTRPPQVNLGQRRDLRPAPRDALWGAGSLFRKDQYVTAVWRLESAGLRPLGRPTVLSVASGARVLSPDGRVLAFSSEFSGRIQLLRLRDLQAEHPFRVVEVGRYDSISVNIAAWPQPRRLLATATDGATHAAGHSVALVIDPVEGRTLKRIPLDGLVIHQVATLAGSLVAMVVPSGRIGTARLVVIDSTGRVRQVQLPAIAGGELGDPGETLPGMTMTAGGNVLVVAAGAPVISRVDLETLSVVTHRVQSLQQPHPPPGSAQETGTAGPGRGLFARIDALPGGNALVWSVLSHPAPLADGIQGEVSSPRFVQIVSTHSWRVVRMLPEVACLPGGGAIVCTPPPEEYLLAHRRHPHSTSIYGPDGRLRGRVAGEWSQITGGWLFAGHADGRSITRYRISGLRPLQHFRRVPPRLWPFDLFNVADLRRASPGAQLPWGS